MNRMKTISRLSLPLLLAVLLIVSASGREPAKIEARKITEGRAQAIIVTPDYDLQVSLWTERPSYFIGEGVRIFINVNKDCYVYIFNTDTLGHTRLIFPNYFDSNNFLNEGTWVIPDPGYRLEVTGPTGREYLRAIAVRARRPFLRDFERFNSSDPFPVLPGGVEGFRQKLESQAPGAPEPPKQPGKLGVVPAPVVPRPPFREYAESYTSFYVRYRWYYDRDDEFYNPTQREKIKFRSVPDDADLYIDGQYYGKTSKKIRLFHGPHKIRMRRRGYTDWVRSIFVDDRSPDTITGYLQPARTGFWGDYRKEWDMDFKDGRYEEESRPQPPELKGREPQKIQKSPAPPAVMEKPKPKAKPQSEESDDEEVLDEKR